MTIFMQSPETVSEAAAPSLLDGYMAILLALDSSDHANHGISMALRIASISDDALITGAHDAPERS